MTSKTTLFRSFLKTLSFPLTLPAIIQNTIALRNPKKTYAFVHHRLINKKTRTIKKITAIPTLKGLYCFITDVAIIKEVLKHRRLEKGACFGEGRQMRVVAEAMGRYRMSKGKEDSKQKRNIMAQLLSNSARYIPSILVSTKDLIDQWSARINTPFYINDDIATFTVSSYLKSVFNYAGKIESIPHILQSQINMLGDRLVYKGPSGKKFEKAFKQKRKALMSYLVNDEGLLSTTEYIDTLSQYIDDQHKSIAQDAFETGLNGAALMGFLAPFPTFLMIIYELGKNPDFQQKLREEANLMIKNQGIEAYIKKEDTFLHATLYEVLRLHPAQPFVFRRSTKKMIFHDVPLSKNTEIVLDLYHSLRNELTWGSDAKNFNPERFILNPGLYRSDFIAYSSGPNNCSGQMYSKITSKAFLASLIQKLSWTTIGEVNDCFSFAMEYDRKIQVKINPAPELPESQSSDS